MMIVVFVFVTADKSGVKMGGSDSGSDALALRLRAQVIRKQTVEKDV
jgi:hypothetical protein